MSFLGYNTEVYRLGLSILCKKYVIDKLRFNFPLFYMPKNVNMMRRLPDFNNETGEFNPSKLLDKVDNTDLMYSVEDGFQIAVKNLFYGDEVRTGLIVQFNPNKLMWHNNITDCTKINITDSIAKMKKRLADMNIEIDFNEGRITRLDVGCAFKVQNEIRDYLNVMESLPKKLKRNLRSERIRDETLYLKNQSFQFLAYNKKAELDKNNDIEREILKTIMNENWLRIETQNINTKATKSRIAGANIKMLSQLVIRDCMIIRAFLMITIRHRKKINYDFYDLVKDLHLDNKRYPVQNALMALGLQALLKEKPIDVIKSNLKSVFNKSENRFIDRVYLDNLSMIKSNCDFELLEEINDNLEKKLNEYLEN